MPGLRPGSSFGGAEWSRRLCGCTKEGVAMRLVELPRPKPTVRHPRPSEPDPDIPELADFPTDIPVNPPPQAAADRECRESRSHQEPSDNEAGSTNTAE